MCAITLWSYVNSEQRKYSLLVPEFFKLIPQSPVAGTQALIYVDHNLDPV